MTEQEFAREDAKIMAQMLADLLLSGVGMSSALSLTSSYITSMMQKRAIEGSMSKEGKKPWE